MPNATLEVVPICTMEFAIGVKPDDDLALMAAGSRSFGASFSSRRRQWSATIQGCSGFRC